MAYHSDQQYRSPFGDTTYTKVFVGGLAWETRTETMRTYFEQFGEILEAVIITDKNTAKSKGYGFVTYRDPAAATRACVEANPMIDGRQANCNIASFGRPIQSPPKGKNQGGIPQGHPSEMASSTQQQTLQTPQFFYQPYGYPYTSAYGYQYYAQSYGGGSALSSSAMANPFYYGSSNGGHSRAGYYYPTTTPNPDAPPFLSSASLPHPSEKPQAQEKGSRETDAVIIRSDGPSS